MTGYDEVGYHNPPPVAEPLATPPAALHSEEFVGDDYGVLGKKTNAPADGGAGSKIAKGLKETISKQDEKSPLRTAIRELIIYFAFLVVVSVESKNKFALFSVAFSASSSIRYYYTLVLINLFTTTRAGPSLMTFNDVSIIDDFWLFTSSQLMDGIYGSGSPDAPRPTANSSFADYEDIRDMLNGTDAEGTNSTRPPAYINAAMIYNENRLLGKPRIRSIRVTNKSCEVVDAFSREIKACYGAYSEVNEDREPFPAHTKKFKYSTAESLETRWLWGQMATYGGGGFVSELSLDLRSDALAVINDLKANRWIDRGTRLVVIDFSVYNANLNLFCVIKLTFELPPTGGIIPTSTFSTMKLIRYVSTMDYVVLVCEGLFCLFVIFFAIEEVYDICRRRLSYFLTFWNLIDFVVLGLSITCIWLSISRTFLARSRIDSIVSGRLQSAPFDDVVDAEGTYNNLAATLLFFAWVKVFKYISFNKTMSQLSATLSRSAKDIGGFAVMFFIFFFAYAQFGYLVFGMQIADYSTFYDAVFACFRTILGDFNFIALAKTNRVLGPVFFITYVFFVFFVLLNMFLAIINDTYVEVKQELDRQSDSFEIAAMVHKGFFRFLRMLRLTKNAETVEPTANFSEWKRALRRNGYTDEQIAEKFAKYDVDNWERLDPEKRDELEAELEEEKRQKNMQTERYKDVAVVTRRVAQMEHSVSAVSGRIEEIIARLQGIEVEKVRTREQANQLMAQNLALAKRDDN